jgi:hypothetical protein
MADLGELAEVALHLGQHGQLHTGAGPDFRRGGQLAGRRRASGRRRGWCSGCRWGWRCRSRWCRRRRRCHSRRRRSAGQLRHPRHLGKLGHPRRLREFRRGRRLTCRSARHGGSLRLWRWLNHEALPFHFVSLEDALSQVLHLHSGRLRRGRHSRRRQVRRLRHAGSLWNWWRSDRRSLLRVVQQNCLPGCRVRDHRSLAGIHARFSIGRAGESIAGLDRRKIGLRRLQSARVFGGYRGSRGWCSGPHCLNRLSWPGKHGTHKSGRRTSGSVSVSGWPASQS